LESYWDRWRDCIAGVRHLPDRSEYQNVCVDEMCKSELTKLHVSDYDEMPAYDKRETWEWLEDRGRCSRERERKRTNEQQTLSALCAKGQGKPTVVSPKNSAWVAPAVPGEEPKGQAEKRAQGQRRRRFSVLQWHI
jgi:hypothetical protein